MTLPSGFISPVQAESMRPGGIVLGVVLGLVIWCGIVSLLVGIGRCPVG